MCYAPITIKNNSKLYRPLTSKDLFKVPCGKCRECQISKENDWFVRIYYEWLRTKQLGGQVFFVSCGYNDAHLPYLDTMVNDFQPLNNVLKDFLLNRSSLCLNDEDYEALRRRVDRYLDRYDIMSYDLPDFKHACFNDEHIVKFFKSLRQYLNADGKLLYTDNKSIKYFCVTEYGDNKHRPHYHMLVFVPIPLDPNYFIKICRKSWSYRVSNKNLPAYVLQELELCKQNHVVYKNFSTPNGRNWNDWHITYQPTAKRYIVKRQFGFVNYSTDPTTNQERPVITDIRGCKYLTRYLNYYDNYLKDLGFEQLKDWIKLFPNIANVSGYEEVNALLHRLKLVFTFKRVSYGFGSLLAEQYNCLSEDELKDVLIKNEVVLPNELRPYPIPSYIVNRLCYVRTEIPDCVNAVSFFTPLGYQVFKDTFDDKIELKKQMYAETVKVLRSFLTYEDIIKFKELYGFDISIIDNPCFGFNYSNLALFDVVLNGVSVSHMTSFMWLEDMTASQILDNCYDIYINQLILRTNTLEAPEVLFDDLYFLRIHNKNYLKERCYNALEQFKYYDQYLTILDYIRHVVLERDSQEQEKKYTDSTKVREALNAFRYRVN